eukprot:TRINITY_DN12946_c0_g1_i1.p1 TRINITY_DN12946_c0_g1~~TRINITY_DN12946_c0_g1_i1.p1  ORF type:complete len:112 (+),score=6.60 TRINITY_DN12946_c0_g1_i1:63-398(+)
MCIRDRNSIMHEIEINNLQKIVAGQLNDTSSVNGPTNITRTSEFITGRNQEIHKLLRFLVESSWQVNLYGEPGVGKSFIASQVGYIVPVSYTPPPLPTFYSEQVSVCPLYF